MILITSIAPVHSNSDCQQTAVASWIGHGYEVVSLNILEECEELRLKYPDVHFFPTTKVLTAIFGKPYVSVRAIFEFAEQQGYESFMLINSDIIIADVQNRLPELEKKADKGLVIFNRWNFTDNPDNAKIYSLGFDGFIINKKYYNLFGDHNFYSGIYCLGNVFFDYGIPMKAMRKNIPIMNPQYKILLHKDHPVQYSMDSWRFLAAIFQQDLNFQPNLKKAEQINSVSYRDIQHGFSKSKHLL